MIELQPPGTIGSSGFVAFGRQHRHFKLSLSGLQKGCRIFEKWEVATANLEDEQATNHTHAVHIGNLLLEQEQRFAEHIKVRVCL